MTEHELRAALIEKAGWLGWHVHAPTASDGDVGFPTLVIAQAGTVLAWQTEPDRGDRVPHRAAWGNALAGGETGLIRYSIVRPADYAAAIADLELLASGRRT